MASARRTDVTHHLTGPLYAVGALFVVMPILDVVAQVWPPSPGSAPWRYGTVGLGANYLISIVFGLLLITAVATWQWHRRTLRFMGILVAALAILAVIATVAFVLDVIQLRPQVPHSQPGAVHLFDVGALKAVVKYLLAAVALAWVALGALRARRDLPSANDQEAPKLVSQHKG